jgi:type IV pilus assembly protein PilX
MTNNPTKINRHPESGAVLIMGLVMVLLISIVALSAIRSSNLQEAMAGNMRDRNMAFQAAESGLVSGEILVDVRKAASPPTCMGRESCYLRYVQPPQDSVIYLDNSGFIGVARQSDVELSGIEEAPYFMIEELSVFMPQDGGEISKSQASEFATLVPYRITALGTGLGAGSSVILQTTYNRMAQ